MSALLPYSFKSEYEKKFSKMYGIDITQALPEQVYFTLTEVVKEKLGNKYRRHIADAYGKGVKRVHYLSIEFLVGTSLKNNLYNLGLVEEAEEIVEQCGLTLEDIYAEEPDAGLGNGGLGRLASCYLDAFATGNYFGNGHSILYEFGIFKQKLINGWQREEVDDWLPKGGVWLDQRNEDKVEVRFGGDIEQFWDNGYNHIKHSNYESVIAIPYDMYISGYGSSGVSKLRLWKATSPGFDMDSFNRGDYAKATRSGGRAELISKVLYPNDNHLEGKLLRLRQEYFLCCAAMSDIFKKHMAQYGTMDNFAEKNAIHINDTHPTLMIPELIRVLLDDCGFEWEHAMRIANATFSYTNHTIMSEALEQWNIDLVRVNLPRIYSIIVEINRRQRIALEKRYGDDYGKINYMSVIRDGNVNMGNLCCYVCHSINGVSKIHSDIIKEQLFHDYYNYTPYKFKNVTNGIAYRRWLLQSNPDLTNLLTSLIGNGFKKDASVLERLVEFKDSPEVLESICEVKHKNKIRLAEYANKYTDYPVDPSSIFDVQAKRMHEYKRQHLNALHIVHRYLQIKNNKNKDFLPRTYFFGAKAAPGYYLAKQMIRLIYGLEKLLEEDADVRDLMRVVYLEDYRVSVSEILMPATEVSEQISLAGTEASGTGNMKLMMGGAVTLGTYDGANVEISQVVGKDNFVQFGLTKGEVAGIRKYGYHPEEYYKSNDDIREAIDFIDKGFMGNNYPELAGNLKTLDPYLVLADFNSYADAQNKIDTLYADRNVWGRMSLMNTAKSGIFSADRSIRDYALNIWRAGTVRQ
ncbi:MAG: glycogen/starch/alpha-glucan phosphorylase [Ruminococcaceae bacterium]|nr:glycogen/starch/alpha-glucan phosphorylase [Oscillospiraceae bacterium]